MSQQINLYQEQFRRRRQALDTVQMTLAIAGLLIVLAAWGGWEYWRASTAEARLEAARDRLVVAEDRVADLRERLAALREELDDNGELARVREEIQAKERLLRYLDEGPLAERAGFSPYLEGLARRTVDDLWLHSIVLRDGGKRLRLEGHALSPASIPELIDALGEESVYRGHAFRALSIDRPEDAHWRVDFVLASDAREADAGRRSRQ